MNLIFLRETGFPICKPLRLYLSRFSAHGTINERAAVIVIAVAPSLYQRTTLNMGRDYHPKQSLGVLHGRIKQVGQ